MALLNYFSRVAATIRLDGWHNAQSESPTFYRANILLSEAVTEEDEKNAVDAYTWITSTPISHDDEFLYKVYKETIKGYSLKSAAILAAGVQMYLSKKARKEALTAQYNNESVGDVGQKVSTTVLIEKTLIRMGHYGESTIVMMKDSLNHKIVWFASGNKVSLFPEGETLKVKGTIKRVEPYNGLTTTYLTRVAKVG